MIDSRNCKPVRAGCGGGRLGLAASTSALTLKAEASEQTCQQQVGNDHCGQRKIHPPKTHNDRDNEADEDALAWRKPNGESKIAQCPYSACGTSARTPCRDNVLFWGREPDIHHKSG